MDCSLVSSFEIILWFGPILLEQWHVSQVLSVTYAFGKVSAFITIKVTIKRLEVKWHGSH